MPKVIIISICTNLSTVMFTATLFIIVRNYKQDKICNTSGNGEINYGMLFKHWNTIQPFTKCVSGKKAFGQC